MVTSSRSTKSDFPNSKPSSSAILVGVYLKAKWMERKVEDYEIDTALTAFLSKLVEETNVEWVWPTSWSLHDLRLC